MAVRKRLLHDDATREKIRTSQLLNRLQDNALAEKEFMTAGQIRSAEIALRKSMPDLAAVDHSGEIDTNITGARWLTEAEILQSSHIAQESNSDLSTTEPTDGLASWPTDGQAKQ
jgi:hypothetical protein